jgi:hypothetical protein
VEEDRILCFQAGLIAPKETAGFGLKDDVVKDEDMQEV